MMPACFSTCANATRGPPSFVQFPQLGVWAFVTGLSQISSFFSYTIQKSNQADSQTEAVQSITSLAAPDRTLRGHLPP